MKTIFITGANRGIGLGFVRYYLDQGNFVIASCRKPQTANELNKLKKKFDTHLTIEQLDVTQEEQLNIIQEKYSNCPVDILINNAGIYPASHLDLPLEKLSSAEILLAFQVNALGSFSVTKSLKNSLLNGNKPIVINLSSQMGSITQTTNYRGYAYRISKSALNMFTKCFASEIKSIITIAIRPGWVKTDMGGNGATLEIHDSVQAMAQFISQLNHSHSGKFFDYLGQEVDLS